MQPSIGMLEKATFPAIIDSSILLTSACPTKFFYQHCIGLSSDKSIHLHAGGAFAKGIETVRKAFYLEKKPLDIALFDGIRAFTNYWGPYDDSPTDGSSGSYKDFINMSAALLDYFRQYNPEDDYVQPYVKQDGSPAVEFTFAIPLPINHPDTGDPLIYGGRSDMIGMYNGMACVVDEKTTYSFPTEWSRPFSMRGQFLGYTWAAQQFNLPVSMCIVRGVAIQQKAIKHLEAILTFPNWQIERWYNEMLYKVQFLVDCWKSKQFPMNYGDICNSYGGCSMLDMCQVKEPEEWISSFTIKKWNPLSVDDAKNAA